MPAQRVIIAVCITPFPANTSPGAQFGHKVKHVCKTEAWAARKWAGAV